MLPEFAKSVKDAWERGFEEGGERFAAVRRAEFEGLQRREDVQEENYLIAWGNVGHGQV